jgi:hypothetical protein
MPQTTDAACDLSTPKEVALFRSLYRPSLNIHTISFRPCTELDPVRLTI